jgi:hypothetical protein
MHVGGEPVGGFMNLGRSWPGHSKCGTGWGGERQDGPQRVCTSQTTGQEGPVSVPLVDDRYFDLAVRNIAKFGDTDVFPLPFENHVLFDSRNQIVQLLQDFSVHFEDRLNDSGPVLHSALSPLGYNGYRWATQIEPIWNAFYLGTVLSLAEAIEDKRVRVEKDVVFSHRLDVSDPEADDLFTRDGWLKFQTVSSDLAKSHQFVVAVDIANFYARIYHHRIENGLKYVDSGGERARQITKLLGSFSQNVSYGLPVGGPASRILSELVLDPVDKILLFQDPPLRFVRYADDYRFFVNSMEDAHRVIALLSEKLQRNEGLSLQRSKTRIMTAAEFLSSTRPHNPTPGSAEKFLSLHLYYDPYSPTAEDDYENLKHQLSEFDVLELLRAELVKGRVDQVITRKLVQALKHMPDDVKEQALFSLLENLGTLAPVIPQVMRAIRENVNDLPDDKQEKIHASIRDLITSQNYIAQVETNLAYMVRVLAQRESEENGLLLMKLFARAHGYTGAPSPEIQREIVLVLGKWKSHHWLHDIRSQYPTMHGWVKRAFFVSSYALGDAGSHWRKQAKRSLGPFDAVVAEWCGTKAQQAGWEIPV